MSLRALHHLSLRGAKRRGNLTPLSLILSLSKNLSLPPLILSLSKNLKTCSVEAKASVRNCIMARLLAYCFLNRRSVILKTYIKIAPATKPIRISQHNEFPDAAACTNSPANNKMIPQQTATKPAHFLFDSSISLKPWEKRIMQVAHIGVARTTPCGIDIRLGHNATRPINNKIDPNAKAHASYVFLPFLRHVTPWNIEASPMPMIGHAGGTCFAHSIKPVSMIITSFVSNHSTSLEFVKGSLRGAQPLFLPSLPSPLPVLSVAEGMGEGQGEGEN